MEKWRTCKPGENSERTYAGEDDAKCDQRAVSRRSRSPRSSDESGRAKPGGAKGGRKVDAQNLHHGKKTKL